MANDDVRGKAESLERARRLGNHLGAQGGHFELLSHSVGLGSSTTVHSIRYASDPGHSVLVRFADEHDLVLAPTRPLAREVSDQMQELARKILHEQRDIARQITVETDQPNGRGKQAPDLPVIVKGSAACWPTWLGEAFGRAAGRPGHLA